MDSDNTIGDSRIDVGRSSGAPAISGSTASEAGFRHDLLSRERMQPLVVCRGRIVRP